MRENGDNSSLPIEVLQLYPAKDIYDITYNDEVVIKRMFYYEGIGYEVYYNLGENDNLLIYNEEFERLLKVTGWNVTYFDQKEMFCRKGNRTVNLKVEDETLKLYIDDDEYTVEGELFYCNDDYLQTILTTHDLYWIFGITIQFDQVNEKGWILATADFS